MRLKIGGNIVQRLCNVLLFASRAARSGQRGKGNSSNVQRCLHDGVLKSELCKLFCRPCFTPGLTVRRILKVPASVDCVRCASSKPEL